MNLYVMEERWVIVGEPDSTSPCGMMVTLKACGVVRIWGTSAGLGELAESGPLAATRIDREPDGVQINTRFVMRCIPCEGKAWAKWMAAKR